jgi:hypothetical protein
MVPSAAPASRSSLLDGAPAAEDYALEITIITTQLAEYRDDSQVRAKQRTWIDLS